MPRSPKPPPAALAALAPAPKNLFVGTSGWAYSSWKPGFYPPDVPARAFLQYYSSRFNSVEVNYTFRKLPERATIQTWLDATPPGFRFCFKAPEQITHRQRLLKSHDTVAEFIESLHPAQDAGKLGPVLFQLPPNFKADNARLANVLSAPLLGSGVPRIAVAVEFRHTSWFTEETFAVLRDHSAALCVADSDDFATPDIVTAPYRYYRLRKSGGYSAPKLNHRAEYLTQATQTSEVFAYLKHEDEPTGALNALKLLQKAVKLGRIQETGK